MDNFYITLISNNTSSSKNQPASFRTYLPYTLHLDGQWECCLAELSFMKSWNNLEDLPDERIAFNKQTTFRFLLDLDGEKSHMGNSMQSFEMSAGHYTQIDDLLSNFNGNYEKWAKDFRKTLEEKKQHYEGITNFDFGSREGPIETAQRLSKEVEEFLQVPFESAIKMGYDSIKKRITLQVNPSIVPALKFSTHLNYMLGFKDPADVDLYWGTWEFDNGLKIAEYPNSGASSLYVYTDIIQPNIVSNKMARLLRIVNGSGEYGTYISKAYTKPYYMPVASNSLNSIEIEIKDEMDRNIKFSFGITIALMHFQRKRTLPLF